VCNATRINKVTLTTFRPLRVHLPEPPKALKLRYAFLTLYSFRLLARREVRKESRLRGSCGRVPRPLRPLLYRKAHSTEFRFSIQISPKLDNPTAPTLDLKAWQWNKTTAWLEFVDRLSSWLWQDNEGDARWTLILDDAIRHAAVNHPTTTVAGVLHHMAGVEQQLLTMRSDEGHGCLEFAVQASDEPAWAVGRVSAAVLAALMERGFARELATVRDTAAHTGLQHAAMFGHAQAARTLLAAPRRHEALVADGDATLDDATRSGTLYSVKGNCDTYWANMLQFPSISSKVPSHFTLVDSGASIHILTCHTFLSDATANHSAVASFAGSTSRAIHKGTFTAFVQCTNNKFHHLVQKHSALVVPDASRTLFSTSQALIGGHHVHFGTSPGLLLQHSKAFIPFVRDTHTQACTCCH
jgi:hypothetical protein